MTCEKIYWMYDPSLLTPKEGYHQGSSIFNMLCEISLLGWSLMNIRDCRCGCVPPDMMSLFQMAELRAKYRQEMKLKASEAAQNEVATPTADADTK